MSNFSHTDAAGHARMVDISAKGETERTAVAAGVITMQKSTLVAIRNNEIAKGDVLGTARIAAIMAAKKTPELIPLCHPIVIAGAQVDFTLDDALPGVRVETIVRCTGKTGVEMEALVATTAALLTIYDMAKAVDRGMVISEVALVSKSGGRSGEWHR